MSDRKINWYELWFPEVFDEEQFYYRFSAILFDIAFNHDCFPWFPEIPKGLFDEEVGLLKNKYSIIRKWGSFYILLDTNLNTGYYETIFPIEEKKVKFFCTLQDFPDLSLLNFNKNSWFLASSWLLNTYVYEILNKR